MELLLRRPDGLLLACLVVHGIWLGAYMLLAPGQGGLFAMCHWDCGWYADIMRHGYDPVSRVEASSGAQTDWAFFPLYPLSALLVSFATGIDRSTAGIGLNWVLLPFLIWLVVLYGMRRGLITRPLLAVTVMLSFPYGLYFRSGYSETVYGGLLIALAWLGLLHRPILAASVAFLLGATRPTGLLVVGILAAAYLWSMRKRGRDRTGWILSGLEACMILGAGGAGLAAYMIFLHGLTGDALAFGHIQRTWNRSFEDPVQRLIDGFSALDLERVWHGGHHSETLMSLLAVAGLLLGAWMVVQNWKLEAFLLLAPVILALSTGLESLPRYLFCGPMGLLAVAALVERMPARPAILSLLVGLQLLLVEQWYHGAAFLT